MSRKAFLDPVTMRLKAHGFIQQNSPGDIIMDVPDEFALSPIDGWKYDNGEFVPFPFPPDPLYLVESAARDQAAGIPEWASWTEAEVLGWLQTNIGTPLAAPVPNPLANLAQARAVIMALIDVMGKQYQAETAMARMIVALRNNTWPGLQHS